MKNLIVISLLGVLASTTASAEVLYRAKTVINGKTFYDLIQLEERPQIDGLKPLRGFLTGPGSFSIPINASFAALPGLYASMEITEDLVENGNKMKIHYSLIFQSPARQLRGTLTIEPEGGEKIEADVQASLIVEDDHALFP